MVQVLSTWQFSMVPPLFFQAMTPELGYVSDNGETENNDFTWSVKGDQLTIVQRHGELIFTIKNLTSTECTFAGRTIPGQEGDMGDVEIHITKVR